MSDKQKQALIKAQDAGADKKAKAAGNRIILALLTFCAMSAVLVPAVAAGSSTIDPDMVDFANLSTLIGNIADLFPGIIELITNIVPLIFIFAILGLITGILDGIVDMVQGLLGFLKR